MQLPSKKCLVVTGPTASGKTRLAVSLARQFGGEIVSADSRQVFRGLDIGTGKDLNEYSEGGAPVRHHLIDVAEPNGDFNLFRFLQMAREAIEDIARRGCLPIVCGGTPLYIKALLDGYDQEGGKPDMELRDELEKKETGQLIEMLKEKAAPRLFQRTDKTQRRRIIRALELALNGVTVEPKPVLEDALVIAPYFKRQELHARIEARLDSRLAEGLVEEVRQLHDMGMSWERMDWLGLEYRFISRGLSGQMDMGDVRDVLLAHIRQFCKRQDGWFRKIERDGTDIHWIPDGTLACAVELVSKWLGGEELPPPLLRLDDIRY